MNRKRAVFSLPLAMSAAVLLMLLVLTGVGFFSTAAASGAARPVVASSAAGPGDVVINEFVAKGTEWVELYNTTVSTIALSGWYVADADCGAPTSSIGAVNLGPGDYYVVDSGAPGDNFDLSNSGDIVVLCDGSHVEFDRVAYGNAGAAPLPPWGVYASARMPSGSDTDDDALDWNLTVTTTKGTTNVVPAVALGSSIILNEFDNYPSAGGDKVELYNPTASLVTITNWYLSDGDDLDQITGDFVVPAGGWLVLTRGDAGSFAADFSSSDVAYLFQPDGTRVDQIGWSGEYENNTFQRIPDGAGPNDGFDWASSGGTVTWFDVPQTLGATNAFERVLTVEKTAPLVANPGSVFTYTIIVENLLGFTLNDIVITDVVPANASFAYALDGGLEDSGVVTWSAATLSHQEVITARFAVTATDALTFITNADYSIAADNHTTPTSGPPVVTVVDSELFIHHVQGSGLSSPLMGVTDATLEGVVVGDFQDTVSGLKGFFIQEEEADMDADPMTSEGIFVYDNGFGVDVNVGDLVRVQGDVNEYYGLTRLRNTDIVTVVDTGLSITPTSVLLPVSDETDYEPFESMLVAFPQDLTVAEVYNLGRYGEVSLAQGGRLLNPTNVITPGVPANDLQATNDLRRLLLDDANGAQNADPIVYPAPELSATNTLRCGYTTTGITGVLDYAFGSYRLQPTAAPAFVSANPRTDAPEDVGGTVRVASFNVLNYFSTIDAGPDVCGPSGDMDCRGADNESEFTRQRDKIINAIAAIDADVVGLIEIENNAAAAVQDLVAGLNTLLGAGTYAYVDTGTIGTDAIKQAFIYKPSTVTPVGSHAILDTSVDPLFNDQKNRPALAQTFAENATSARFTAVVNHLKSKGSSCTDVGDPDVGDGQGNCNLTRTAAANALAAWLATDPTGSGDPDFLIIGDLNSYAKEDPITLLKDAGYADLIDTFVGAGAYSYVFDGQAGYLDHALANDSLSPQVISTTIWHINSDEPRVLDYNEEYKSLNQVTSLYSDDPYRASDHDPVIVGLELVDQTGLNVTKSAAPAVDVPLGATITYTIAISNAGTASAVGVVMTDALPLGLTFGGWTSQGSAMPPMPSGAILWGPWDVPAGEEYAFSFTATVTTAVEFYGTVITNTVDYDSENAGSGSYAAALTVVEQWPFDIFLPIVMVGQ